MEGDKYLEIIRELEKERDLLEEIEIALNNRIMDLEEIEEEHRKENGKLRTELKSLQEATNRTGMFRAIEDEMYDLYMSKNNDYGDSVHNTYKQFGLVSFWTRMSDKLNRLITLDRTKTMVNTEKIEDTLIDIANYSILAIMEIRKEEEI